MRPLLKIFLVNMMLTLSISNVAGQEEEDPVDFFYRYRIDLNNVEYSVNLNNIPTTNDNDTVLFFMNFSVTYLVEKAGSADEVISTYSHCYALRDTFINNSTIANRITNALGQTHSYASINELLYSRDINYAEIKPNEVKVQVVMQPRIVPIRMSVLNSCSDGTFILPSVTNTISLKDLYPDYDINEIECPDCIGKLVPDYYKDCSKFDFTNDAHVTSTSGDQSFKLNYTVRYECFMPNLVVFNFYDRIKRTYSRSVNNNILNPYKEIPELANLVQQPDYCKTLPDCGNLSPDGCEGCKNYTNINLKGDNPSVRTVLDVVGSDYFTFKQLSSKVFTIDSDINSIVRGLDPNAVLNYEETLWYQNRRSCNNIDQYNAIDRRSPPNYYEEENYLDGLTLVKWELLQRVEQYYGGSGIPEPHLNEFEVVFTTEKRSGYLNDKGFVYYPAPSAIEKGYFDNTGIEMAICNQYYDQGSNFYSDNSNTFWSTCPPLKMYYQNIPDINDKEPVFTKYQYMVRETYRDFRVEDGLQRPLGASGVLLSGEVSYMSDIITEFHVFPDISSVDVEITYPCKDLSEITVDPPQKLGKIEIESVTGGRPWMSSSNRQGHAYELYGLEMGCSELEFYETNYPGIIRALGSIFDAFKQNNVLHLLPFKKIPKQGGSIEDYNKTGEFSVPCGIYWIRIVPNNRVRNVYSGISGDWLVWGTSTYDVTPWDKPVIMTAKDVAPVTLTYLPSICNDAPYLLQAEAPGDYVSNIDYWTWNPPKLLDENGDPIDIEAEDGDKKKIFPGHPYCDQAVTGVYENGCISTASIEVPDFQPPLLDPDLLQNVLQISATKMRATWVKDFVDERFEDADGYRAMIEKDMYSAGQLGSYKIRSVHDYLDERVQTNDEEDVPVPILKTDGVINDVASFNWTHPRFEISFPKWVNNGRILKYNTSGQAIEGIDLMDNFGATIFGFDGSIPVGVAVNARNREIGFEGFEEYPESGTVTPLNNMQGNLDLYNLQEEVTLEKYHTYNILAGSGRYILTDIPEGKYSEEQLKRVIIEVDVPAQISGEVIDKKSKSAVFTMSAGIIKKFCYDYGLMLELPDKIYDAADRCEYWQGQIHIIEEIHVEEEEYSNIKIVRDIAHTGNRSLKIEPCPAPVTMKQNVLELSEGKEYIISAWIKTAGSELLTPNSLHKRFKEKDMGIELKFDLETSTIHKFFLPNGAIVEGWQKLEHTFTYPEGSKNLSFVFRNSDDFYLDDIRIFPKEGNIQTYVYDPSTYRVEATLDQNNFATIYKYDDEGKLFQVKKETAEGIKTLQVNQSYLEPKP